CAGGDGAPRIRTRLLRRRSCAFARLRHRGFSRRRRQRRAGVHESACRTSGTRYARFRDRLANARPTRNPQHESSANFCRTPCRVYVALALRISLCGYRRPMVSMLDLERFRATPLTREPFEFLVVPEFVKPEARAAIDKDYPEVARAGSFPLREVTYGPAFATLIEEMRSEEFRKAFEQ